MFYRAETHLGAVGLAGVLLVGGILLLMGRAGRRKYTDILDHCDSSDDHNDTVGFVGVVGKLGVLCGVGDFTYEIMVILKFAARQPKIQSNDCTNLDFISTNRLYIQSITNTKNAVEKCKNLENFTCTSGVVVLEKQDMSVINSRIRWNHEELVVGSLSPTTLVSSDDESDKW